MRITILAPGSRGDIQPYVALGRGLLAAGHTVRMVTTRDHAALVTEHGLDLHALDIDVQAAIREIETSASLESGKLLASFRRIAELGRRSAAALAEGGLEACRGADAVLTGFSGLFMGMSIAEELGLPLLQAYNVPFSPTRDFPGALTPGLSFWPRGLFHRLGHHLSRQVLWLTARAAGNQARTTVLGLPPAPFFGPFSGERLGRGLVLYGFSPAVLGRPADWGPSIEVTGYWFLDAHEGWAPPPDLVEFLARGPTPVYVGFGSMSHRSPEETAQQVISALRATGQRAILHAGWGGLRAEELPETMKMVGSVPHAWLFDRVSAVVHHGGAGTTAAGLRAGVPNIVVPFHGDQPFWARRVAELGAGPPPLPRKRLTAARLARAIEAAVTDREMRRRAHEVGEQIRSDDGVARAVEAIGRLDRARRDP